MNSFDSTSVCKYQCDDAGMEAYISNSDTNLQLLVDIVEGQAFDLELEAACLLQLERDECDDSQTSKADASSVKYAAVLAALE